MERKGKKKYRAKESREELDKHSMWIRSMLEKKKVRNVNVLTRDWFQNNADKLPNLKEKNFVEGGTEISLSGNWGHGSEGGGQHLD